MRNQLKLLLRNRNTQQQKILLPSVSSKKYIPKAAFLETAAVAGVAVVGGLIYLTKSSGDNNTFNTISSNENSGNWDWNWDDEFFEIDDPILKKRVVREQQDQIVVRELIFIRHGQYANMHSDNDRSKILTPLGQRQAAAVGKRLKQLFGDGNNITCLYHSNLTRARETANIIMSEFTNKPPKVETHWLAEGVPCIPDPTPAELTSWDEESEEEAIRMETAFRIFCGRPQGQQENKRIKARSVTPSMLQSMMVPKSSIEIYVCHGNLIRFFFLRAIQLPPKAWLRLSTYHSGITWLTVHSDGVVTAREFGNSGHLNPNEMSG